MSEHKAEIFFENQKVGPLREWFYRARCLTCEAEVCDASTDEDQVNQFAANHLKDHPKHRIMVGRMLHLLWRDTDEETD